MSASEFLRYYTIATEASDLGHNRALAADLPRDQMELGVIVRGLLVHDFLVKVRGLELRLLILQHADVAVDDNEAFILRGAAADPQP